EAANRSQLARFRRALQRWAIADLQVIGQQLDPFWPKPGEVTQFEQSARNLFQQLSMNLQLIAPHQRFDLAGEVGAEAGQLLNLLDRQIGYAGWVFSDGARGVAVSAHAEEIAPAYLEQVGDLIQDASDLLIVHRHSAHNLTISSSLMTLSRVSTVPGLRFDAIESDHPPWNNRLHEDRIHSAAHR